MADFSYQGLVGALAPQQQPQTLWDGLSQTPQMPNSDPSMLALMLAKQAQQQNPRAVSREINPGVTWGGRDQNAIQPNDVMQSRYFPQAPDSI